MKKIILSVVIATVLYSSLTAKIEKTFAIIKPNAVKAKNSGKIIDRIEEEGFTILKMQKLSLSIKEAETFYSVHKERPFFPSLISSMTSSPVIVMVLEKDEAIKAWRDLMGATNPAKAADKTLRKLYGENLTANATHGSDAEETAHKEIRQFFPELTS